MDKVLRAKLVEAGVTIGLVVEGWGWVVVAHPEGMMVFLRAQGLKVTAMDLRTGRFMKLGRK